MFCFFNDTATTEIYTLSLHDALPISVCDTVAQHPHDLAVLGTGQQRVPGPLGGAHADLGQRVGDELRTAQRSEEHTSELQSRQYLVCRLLLEKKNLTSQ